VFENTAASPALPLATALPLLSEHSLSARAARILEHNKHFQVLQFRSHQFYYVHNFVTSTLSLPISINALACAFDCRRDGVTSALARSRTSGSAGRHLGLAEDMSANYWHGFTSKPQKTTLSPGAIFGSMLRVILASLQRGVGSIPSMVATLTKYTKPKVHRKSSHALRFPVVF
jgi:hypothetical protein